MYVLNTGKEAESYRHGQERLHRLKSLLRNPERHFDLCRSDCRMVPLSISPVPVLLHISAPLISTMMGGGNGVYGETIGGNDGKSNPNQPLKGETLNRLFKI